MSKHKNNNCKNCGGEGVVYVKGKKGNSKYTGYYEVCSDCNPSKEDKEGDFSGADAPGEEGNR